MLNAGSAMGGVIIVLAGTLMMLLGGFIALGARARLFVHFLIEVSSGGVLFLVGLALLALGVGAMLR